MQASVKIMRSYDYCHFEVTLGSDDDLTLDQVNELRKQAALLADEAVRQYKVAKAAEAQREQRQWELERSLAHVERITKKSETEWTPEEAALMRAHADGEFWKAYHDNDYFYADDPDREHHFSMLRRFQDTRIKAG